MYQSFKSSLQLLVLMFMFMFMFSFTVFANGSNFESGWGILTNSTTPHEDFTRRSGGTPSGSTGPSQGANGTLYYAYFETSSGAAYDSGDTAYLTSNSVTASHVSFYYHMYGGNIGSLAVEKLTNGNWVEIWKLSGQQHTSHTSPWSKVTIKLSNLPETNQVRFVAKAVGGWQGDIAIDEVEFKDSLSFTKYAYDASGNRIRVSGGLDDAPAPNYAPTAVNDSTSFSYPSTSQTLYVLQNDSDPEDDALSIVSINNSDGRFSVTVIEGNRIRIDINYSAEEFISGFTYTISDGNGNYDTATANVHYVGGSGKPGPGPGPIL